MTRNPPDDNLFHQRLDNAALFLQDGPAQLGRLVAGELLGVLPGSELGVERRKLSAFQAIDVDTTVG